MCKGHFKMDVKRRRNASSTEAHRTTCQIKWSVIVWSRGRRDQKYRPDLLWARMKWVIRDPTQPRPRVQDAH